MFISINAGPIGAPMATILRITDVIAFCVLLWLILVKNRRRFSGPLPPRAALRTYWICVIGEVVAIPVGALILRALHQPLLTPVWVVLVLGVHFLPFARAFGVRLFAALGTTLIVVAVAGGVATISSGAVAAAWTGTAAGVLLLAFSAFGAVNQHTGQPLAG